MVSGIPGQVPRARDSYGLGRTSRMLTGGRWVRSCAQEVDSHWASGQS